MAALALAGVAVAAAGTPTTGSLPAQRHEPSPRTGSLAAVSDPAASTTTAAAPAATAAPAQAVVARERTWTSSPSGASGGRGARRAASQRTRVLAPASGTWSAWGSGARPVRVQPAAYTTSMTATLAQGSRGDAVAAWQQDLSAWRTAHGRGSIAADGDFGALTRAATADFQRASAVSADGVVGAQTLAAMSAASSAPASAPGTSAAAVVSTAKQYLGVPYRYGGTSPAGFDCAGFTQYVFGRTGVSLPRTSAAQAATGTSVSSSAARAGDLVVFWSGSSAYHVGIYLGSGQMIAAPKTGDHVKVEAVYSTAVTYRRVLTSA